MPIQTIQPNSLSHTQHNRPHRQSLHIHITIITKTLTWNQSLLYTRPDHTQPSLVYTAQDHTALQTRPHSLHRPYNTKPTYRQPIPYSLHTDNPSHTQTTPYSLYNQPSTDQAYTNLHTINIHHTIPTHVYPHQQPYTDHTIQYSPTDHTKPILYNNRHIATVTINLSTAYTDNPHTTYIHTITTYTHSPASISPHCLYSPTLTT
jgi:hypothetical protein